MKKVELLSPAGSIEAAKAAINAGADAIYIGGAKFGARAYAKNPEEDDLLSIIQYAHLRGRKVFLTINTLLKNDELKFDLFDFLCPYYEVGVDGVIVQDLGVMSFIKEYFPGLPIHCSTQMTISNLTGAKLMTEEGAERVVLSRELSLDEIKEITNKGIETECFIQGALCYCYSGQCFLSSILGGRSGNRGRCAQPCRLPYTVKGKTKHFLSPKDLCTIEHLPDLINAGIYSFKIEGRMKRAEYTAAVTSVYRKYIDLALSVPADKYKVDPKDMEILLSAGNRSGFTSGYYYQHNGKDMMSLDKPDYDTAGEDFFNIFKEKYVDVDSKEKIKGIITLHTDSPSKLELSYGDISLEVTGATVQKAQNAPLNEEKVLKQIKKTGDSAFVFESLEIDMDSDTFMPVKDLNDLRRSGIEALERWILGESERASVDKPSFPRWEYKRIKADADFALYIESAPYLLKALDYEKVTRIYFNCSCFKMPYDEAFIKRVVSDCHEAGKEAFFVFPAVFRKETDREFRKCFEMLSQNFDGMMAKTIDELGFLLEMKYEGPVVADFNLYSFNQMAVSELENLGVGEKCAPIELNHKELSKSDVIYDEMVVYGHYPLMVSAQCLKNNTTGCDKSGVTMTLKDRMNKTFNHKSFCDYCYSVIYNSVPLDIINMKDEIEDMGIKRLRINLTNESVMEADKILNYYLGDGQMEFEEFTRGHFNRGVE